MSTIYEHTQKGSRLIYWLILPIVLEFIAITSLVVFLNYRSEKPLPLEQLMLIIALVALIPAGVLGWVMLMMSSLTVSVDSTLIRIRFGGGAYSKKFPLERISDCGPVKNDWMNGWGIRYIGKGWLYNVAGLDAVELTLKNGKRVRIGTDEPEKLAEAIRSVLPAASS